MPKHTTLEQLKLLAQRTKGEISKVESKSLVGVKVNGVALAIADKMVDILIASGATNGTLAVNGKDVAVTGLAALAYKAQISEADLDTALKTVLDGKASGADLATLIGTDAGKSARTIANEELAAQLIPEGAQEALDTLTEIAQWIQDHPNDASAMNAAITKLNGIVAGIGGDEDEYATVMAAIEGKITAALKDIASGATKVEKSEVNGNIKINGQETVVYRADPPLTEEQPHTEAPQGAEHEGEPPAQDGSLSASPKVEHHFSDEEVRRHYEHILTSTDLYPPELHQAVRAVLADGVTDYNWTEKGREVCGLFSAYGDREFQGEVLYRTKPRGEDGISFYFDDGYTYFPWPSLANLLDALIETGAYPDITAEEESDPIGAYNIPDEVEEMGGGPQREIGQADYDYVLGAVAYEAGETAEEPVRPQAVFTEIKGIPKADEIDTFVPEPVAGGQQVIVAADQANLTPPAEESPSPHESRGNTTAHKNFRRFQKLFPEIVSGQYESLRLEAGDAYDPLVIHHKYGDYYCMEHYYMQNGDRMYDPYMDFLIDTEAGTLRAFSYYASERSLAWERSFYWPDFSGCPLPPAQRPY